MDERPEIATDPRRRSRAATAEAVAGLLVDLDRVQEAIALASVP
jgi:hypothetical protein